MNSCVPCAFVTERHSQTWPAQASQPLETTNPGSTGNCFQERNTAAGAKTQSSSSLYLAGISLFRDRRSTIFSSNSLARSASIVLGWCRRSESKDSSTACRSSCSKWRIADSKRACAEGGGGGGGCGGEGDISDSSIATKTIIPQSPTSPMKAAKGIYPDCLACESVSEVSSSSAHEVPAKVGRSASFNRK